MLGSWGADGVWGLVLGFLAWICFAHEEVICIEILHIVFTILNLEKMSKKLLSRKAHDFVRGTLA